MTKNKYPKIRLFTNENLSKGQIISLSRDQSHYLSSVMRQKTGYEISLFNGFNGQWSGQISLAARKQINITLTEQTRKQTPQPNATLCFALIKNTPLNNIVQKATELGVSTLQPIITDYTAISKINLDRLKANAIEASEQCGRLTVPEILPVIKLDELIKSATNERITLLCNESGQGEPAISALQKLESGAFSVIIGPEGGFSKREFELMQTSPYITSITMGPRILRADTAAIAALTCCMSILGDWDEFPNFNR